MERIVFKILQLSQEVYGNMNANKIEFVVIIGFALSCS